MKVLAVLATLLPLEVTIAQVGQNLVVNRPGDGGLATNAEINDPQAIALDGSKFLYIVENTNFIRRVDLNSGIISTVYTKTKLEPTSHLFVNTDGSLIVSEF